MNLNTVLNNCSSGCLLKHLNLVVCSQVMAHSTPQGILDDVAMVSLVLCTVSEPVSPQLHNLNSSPSSPQVLDEEAEVFIVKMWRLLIYETEAKKIGLGK